MRCNGPFLSRALCPAAEALREQGVAHVVYWDKTLTPCPKALHVTQFSHAFFATLRNKSATVPEVCFPFLPFTISPV
jgi:hypothetical protein